MKNQQSLVEALQNWTPNHSLKQWYWFPLAYFPSNQDPLISLLKLYNKLKKIATGNYEDIVESERDKTLMKRQNENVSAKN